MELTGFPTDSFKSFPSHRDILAYINHIVDRCDLRQYIKVRHHCTVACIQMINVFSFENLRVYIDIDVRSFG